MNLGENLRHIREARQIGRHALADALNLSYSSICKYESGLRTPDYDTLAKMADVFQVSMEALLTPHSKKDVSGYPTRELPGGAICEPSDTYDADVKANANADADADAEQEKQEEITGLNDEELYLITLYRGLDSKRKSAVRDLLEPLAVPEIWRAQTSKRKKRKRS